MRKENVVISSPIITLFSAYKTMVADYLREQHVLTYNQFLALLFLRESQQSVQSSLMASALFVKPNTLIPLLLSLEDLHLVRKTIDPLDKRRFLCTLTKEGCKLQASVSQDLGERFGNIFIATLPESELQMLKPHIGVANNNLRTSPLPSLSAASKDNDYLFDFYTNWKVLPEFWGHVVRQEAALSLAEYRILKYVRESGSVSCGEISEALVMDKGGVSRSKEVLRKRGMLLQGADMVDGRVKHLACSPEGQRLLARADVQVEKVMTRWLTAFSSEEVAVLNAWHARMYMNMRLLLRH